MKVLSKQESKQISGADLCQCLDVIPKLDRELKAIDINHEEAKTFTSLSGHYNVHTMLVDAVSVNTDKECKGYCCEAIYYYTALSPTTMYKFGNNDANFCNKIM